jgi:hypothetical protein
MVNPLQLQRKDMAYNEFRDIWPPSNVEFSYTIAPFIKSFSPLLQQRVKGFLVYL